MASETERKYQDIRSEYQNVWLKKRYKDVPIHTSEYIYTKLGEKYYLAAKTIENILCFRTKLIAD